MIYYIAVISVKIKYPNFFIVIQYAVEEKEFNLFQKYLSILNFF